MTHEFQGKTINVLCAMFVLVLPTSTVKPIFLEASLFFIFSHTVAISPTRVAPHEHLRQPQLHPATLGTGARRNVNIDVNSSFAMIPLANGLAIDFSFASPPRSAGDFAVLTMASFYRRRAQFRIWPIIVHVHVMRYCGGFSLTLVI
jgi:hypothetical protein